MATQLVPVFNQISPVIGLDVISPENRLPQISKGEAGRPPTAWENPETEQNILHALKCGATRELAADIGGISYRTLLRRIQDDEIFGRKVKIAENYLVTRSGENVVELVETKDKTLSKEKYEMSRWAIQTFGKRNNQVSQANTQVNIFNQIEEKFTKTVDAQTGEIIDGGDTQNGDTQGPDEN